MDSITASIAVPSDIDEMFEFMMSDFLLNESLNGALQLKRNECEQFFTALIRKAVSSGTCVILRSNTEKGRVVGMRLSAFEERGVKEEGDENENVQYSEKAQLIGDLLEKVSEKKWEKIPSDINKVFYIIVITVSKDYTRRGLGKVLLEYGMDDVIARGAKGILSEATARNSQMLFAKLGYSILNEIHHSQHLNENGERIFNCPDGTDTAKLVFRRIDPST